jgi:uncharacterized RDD family membrane protein YckC
MSCPVCGHVTWGVWRGRGARGTGSPVPRASPVGTGPLGTGWAAVELEAAVVTRPSGRLRPPAPVWARLAAAAIDEVALTVPLIAVVLLGLRAARSPGAGWDLVSTLGLICWVVAALLYGVVGGGEGQTPGKRALKIVVVDEQTGAPIGYERALVRTLVLLLLVLPCCLGLLSIVATRSDRHRGWHDRAAGSVVVRGFLS